MPDLTITIPLDSQRARAYSSASPVEKKKIEAWGSQRAVIPRTIGSWNFE
jgi:hypothetical protein